MPSRVRPKPPRPDPTPAPAPAPVAPTPVPPAPRGGAGITADTPIGDIGDVSVAAFRAFAKGTPLEAVAAECVAAAKGWGTMALTFAKKESSLGTGESAKATRNPLGLMRRAGDARPCLQLAGGCLLTFPAWADAFAEYAARIASAPYDPSKSLKHNVLVYVGGPRCPDILAADPNGVCANGHRWDAGDPDTDLKTYTEQTAERINAVKALDGDDEPSPKPRPKPKPTPNAKPNMTKGLVPLPPYTERFVTPDMKPAGVGWDNIGKREVWGLSRHRMQGTLAGTNEYFHRRDIAALTDFGMDHQTAEMIQWLDPFGWMTPHASGPVNAPYGDGAAFLAKWQAAYTASVVNRMRVSMEIAGFFAQPGTNVTADSPWSDLSQRRFAQFMAHFAHDYGIAWSDFPNHPDDGFSFLCDHVEFTKGTGKLCAGALVIAATGNVIQLTADILKAAQLGGAKPPAPTPGIAYPEGLDRALAAELFGRVEVGGTVYAYNELGPVSRLWLDLGITHEPHLFPSIERVTKGSKGEHFFFDNGLVLFRADDRSAFRTVGDEARDDDGEAA